MLATVLKAFPYAHDHAHVVKLAPGEVVDIDDGVYEGLEAEGFIREPTEDEVEATHSGVVVVTSPVEIPDGWAKLTWFQLQALARKLGAGPKITKPTAVAVIEAELASRAKA